jgi:hypothetical protein
LSELSWEVKHRELEWGMGPFNVEKRVHANVRIGDQITGDLFWDFEAEKNEDWVIISGERGEVEFSVFEAGAYTVTTRAAGRETYPFHPPEHVQQPFIQMVVNHLCFGTEAPADARSAAETSLILDKILARAR